jgi:hypothetical protein
MTRSNLMRRRQARTDDLRHRGGLARAVQQLDVEFTGQVDRSIGHPMSLLCRTIFIS